MSLEVKNFVEYLSHEEHNLLVSLHNLKDEIDWLYRFDKAWQENFGRIKISDKRSLMMRMLCNDCHVRFYVCFASLFRARFSESYATLRRSIDATLHVYREFEEPGYCESYLVEKPGDDVTKNKSYIKQKHKLDATKFSLSPSLVNFYEKFSSVGPHADPGGISIGHYTDEASDEGIPYSYFQTFEKSEMEFWYFTALRIYLDIYQIFDLYSKEYKIILLGKHQTEVQNLSKRMNAFFNSTPILERFRDRASNADHN